MNSYPFNSFQTIAKNKLLQCPGFKNMPTWAKNSWEKPIHPVVFDYRATPDPNSVLRDHEIDVTVYLCPRVRIEGVYFVTFNKYHTPVVYTKDNLDSLVENPDHWIKIAKQQLPENQRGIIAVTLKYKLIKLVENIWEVTPVSEPVFRFTTFSEEN